MHNFRKIKKKKKKITIIQQQTPEETLMQISDMKEDSRAQLELQNLISIYQSPKKQLKKKQCYQKKLSYTSRCETQENKAIPPKYQYSRHLLRDRIEPKIYETSLQNPPIRFVHMKKYKTEEGQIQEQATNFKTIRSNTVFSLAESSSFAGVWRKRRCESAKKTTFVNLKDPLQVRVMHTTPAIIVKNMRLESRYRPIYLQ